MSKTTTKMAIAFAFKELLLEKPLDSIAEDTHIEYGTMKKKISKSVLINYEIMRAYVETFEAVE